MFLNVTLHLHTYISAYIVYHKSTKRARDGRVARVTTGRLFGSDTTTVSLLRQFRSPSIACPVRDFAFPDTNFVKALLAMLSALRLVAGCKHAPGTLAVRRGRRERRRIKEYTKPTRTHAK